MTSQLARIYATALAILVFFLTWAGIAARPWAGQAAATHDPSVAALDRRAKHLRAERARVQRLLDRRFAAYRAQLRARQKEIAAVRAANAAPPPVATPSVAVVSAPPVTATRTS